MERLLPVVIVLLLAAPARGAEPFTYADRSHRYTVTEQGLSAIVLDGKRVARGGVYPFNATGWFNAEGSQHGVTDEPAGPATLSRVDDRTARVTQRRGHLDCVTEYAFDTQDVTVTVRVTNTHPTAPLEVLGIGGLFFDFDRVPDGYRPEQHYSYFRKPDGVRACHPGWFQRIGGTWAADDYYGVGTSPATVGRHRTLTLWYYEDWDPATGQAKSKSRQLMHFVHVPTPPGGTNVYGFKIRVGRNRRLEHLLAPYKVHFDKTWGDAPRYEKDTAAWWACDFLHDDKPGAPGNPHGFFPHARLDREADAKLYAMTMVELLHRGGRPAAGLIIWAHYGSHPRGAMYREDVDAATPEVVEKHLRETVVPTLRKAGLRVGIAMRPADAMVPWTRTADGSVRLDPRVPGHTDLVLKRFAWATDMGFDAFYLDSFGDSLEDVELLRAVRAKLGPKVVTFAEHVSDAALLDTAIYSELTYLPDGKLAFALGEQQWRAFRFLVPRATVACRLRVKGDTDFARLDASGPVVRPYYAAQGLTPLTARYDLWRWKGPLPPAE